MQMQLFNIGPLELIGILVIALVILGPKEMIGTARKVGGFVSRVVKSPVFKTVVSTSKDLRELPTKIVKEAGLEQEIKEIQGTSQQVQAEIKGQIQPDELGQSNVQGSLDEAIKDINRTKV
jgi:sec-independent protein translocase protein TatB